MTVAAPPRILIVDDNSVDREAVTRLLRADHTLFHAATGAEGLAAYEEHRPHCVLLDFRLPDVDGSELLPALLKRASGIVMLTGQGDEHVAATCLRGGAHDYLTKREVTRESLLRAIRNATEKAELLRRLERTNVAQRMEAVGRLAAGIAHDFNNLMMVVESYANIVSESLADGTTSPADVQVIRDAATRAAGLTAQLLTFSRQQVQQLAYVCLNTSVRKVETMLRRVIGEHIELRSNLDERLGDVKADITQVEQVLMNLVLNARDAMPTGGTLTLQTMNVTLTAPLIAGEQEVPSGRYVVLAVSDTGEGMAENVRRHIFEPFFTTKEQGKGTGLGLSTTYGIVRQSGGHVWVDSTPAQGSTFRIYLPRSDAALEPRAPVRARPPRSTGGNETLLLVEDEPMLRRALSRTLRKHGYRVLEAENASTAIATASGTADPIHLLVTDMVIPGGSGREVAEQILASRTSIRTIFMSGYTDDEVMRGGLLDGTVRFLQKPFPLDDLMRVIRQVLDA